MSCPCTKTVFCHLEPFLGRDNYAAKLGLSNTQSTLECYSTLASSDGKAPSNRAYVCYSCSSSAVPTNETIASSALVYRRQYRTMASTRFTQLTGICSQTLLETHAMRSMMASDKRTRTCDTGRCQLGREVIITVELHGARMRSSKLVVHNCNTISSPVTIRIFHLAFVAATVANLRHKPEELIVH